MKNYLLIFRDTNWDQGLLLEQIRETMDGVQSWLDGLSCSGRIKGGSPLDSSGRMLSGSSGQPVADGPFAESKEAIAGFLLIEAADLEEAAALARSNPVLRHGARIEIRPALPECPVMLRAKARLADAGV